MSERRPAAEATPGRDGEPAGPLVSVILPCWNAEAAVERAVASVLRESSVDLECIVVDDGSTDRTAEIVGRLAAADPRVRLIRLAANEGVSGARNRALDVARGTWLTLLDADDRFVGGGVGALLEAAVRTDALAVVGQQVWTDGRRRWRTELYDIPDITTPRRTSLAASPGLLYHVSPHAKLIHRSCVEGLHFEGRVLGDQPWVIRALLRAGDRLEVIGETVYEWWRPRRRDESASITASTRASARRGLAAAGVATTALRQVIEEAEAAIPDPALRQRFAARYVERLLRSDLAAHLAGALGRRDPGTGELLAAIEGFVVGVPPTLVARSYALARDVLEPAFQRWHRLDVPARAALWSLLRAAGRRDPNVWQRGADPVSRAALRLAVRDDRPLARGVAVGLLLADGVPRRLAALGRRVVRRLLAAVSRPRP